MTEENKSVKKFPNSRNIPGLRFLEFNDEWKNKKLGEIGDVKMCRRVFNNETSIIGEIPFFKIGSFGKEADAYISKELYLDYKKRFSFPKKGDILISAAGTIGRTVIYNGEDAYYQDSNIVWIDNDNSKITNEFLYHILQIIKFNTEGGTIQRLYNSILKSTKFSNPSISEQNKIAEFLSLVDKRILTQRKVIEGLITQKNYIIKKLFEQNLSDSNTILLSDFLKIPERIKPDFIDKEKLLTVKLHLKGVHKNENSDSLSLGATNYFVRKKGQFIYGKQNLFNGAFALIPDRYDGFLSSADVPTLDINESIVNAKYLFYFFSRESFYKKLEDIASGSGSKRIHENTLLSLKITLPSLTKQNKMADLLSKLDEKINVEKELLIQFENQKKYLLQNLFV